MDINDRILRYLLNEDFDFNKGKDVISSVEEGKLTYTSCREIIRNIEIIKKENMSHEDMILKCLESGDNSNYIRKSALFMLSGGKISHEMSLYAINKKNEICGVWQDGNYKKREKMTFAKFKNILKNGAKV